MLGKGLESLIPPSTGPQPSQSSGGQAGQEPQSAGENNVAALNTPQGANFSQPDEPLILHTVAPESPAADFAVAKTDIPSAPVVPQKKYDDFMPPFRKEKTQPKPAADDYIYHIEVAKITPNPSQPRRNFDEEGLRELAQSIREFGFLQPLVVTKAEKETENGVEVGYQLIAGERRLLAAKLLGLESVPAIVKNVDFEREKLEMAVIENIQRADLNPIETARALARLQDEFRLTQREIAAKLGKSREVVANTVRLLSLPMYIQESLERGQISGSHGRLLLAVADLGAQKKLFEDITARGMTTRELKYRVQAAKPRKSIPREELPPELKMMEDRLSAELGTPVKIERSAGTGKIVITFYSEEELEGILQRIGNREV